MYVQDKIFDLSHGTWAVLSKSRVDVLYTVTVGDFCDGNIQGNSHCGRCGACAFMIRCTCPDSMNPGVACIHLHAGATFSPSCRFRSDFFRYLDGSFST
ncbi:hypothetical protein Y032_0485g2330 [Ancylostoma ceylanicum]|uniref:Uncharacterized protein n=1 Tax=Ancylostoma ceylanicum TaxID=53326 RepID=A0A016WXC4_9BILA|nr:hypothetical protein Y032_0485g2330 [Ancylostoma ceylanicum]